MQKIALLVRAACALALVPAAAAQQAQPMPAAQQAQPMPAAQQAQPTPAAPAQPASAAQPPQPTVPRAEPSAVDAVLAQQLQRLAGESAGVALGVGKLPVRVEVELGRLDPRLKLAPCDQIQPYLPTGLRPYGRTRIGLRCLQGPTKWNVYLPVTVKLFAPALVAANALPAGTVLQQQHLQQAEVDLAAGPDPVLTQPATALGRTLARALPAGAALHRGDLRARQYFNAGDVVRVVAVGPGYAVSVEGQAVSNGVEGQPARVRVESGRILSGMPTADRRLELSL